MSDVPEADALEQETPVQPGPEDLQPDLDPEVPEADAIEQSQTLEDSDDDHLR